MLSWWLARRRHLHGLVEDGSHAGDDRVGIASRMVQCPFQIVDNRKPCAGYLGPFEFALTVEFTGIPLAQVVQVGECAAPTILKPRQLVI